MTLNQPLKSTNLYQELKSCLILDESKQSDIEDLDEWFMGCMTSLFYRPKNKILVLISTQGIGKSTFIRDLTPKREWIGYDYSSFSLEKHLIVDMSEHSITDAKKVMSTDQFRIPYSTKVEKRLSSVIYTSNWVNPELTSRRRSIVLYLKDIDKMKFNNINKEHLWIEIYHQFLESHSIGSLFTREEIDEYFKD